LARFSHSNAAARLAPQALLAAALAAGAATACSWKAPERGGSLPGPLAAPSTLAKGASLSDVLALVRSEEPGGMDVELRELRVSRVTDGYWEPVDPDDALSAPQGELAVIAVRRCGDWTGRDHWEAERASWFIHQGGTLAAFDHWSFGPRCALGNQFAPSPPALLETEQELRRFVDQRHPPAWAPLAIRFRRGLAFLGAGRSREALAELNAGDQALAARESLFRERDATPLEQETFRLESEELYRLREELAAALAEEGRGRAQE
jgi:hypothetical protein